MVFSIEMATENIRFPFHPARFLRAVAGRNLAFIHHNVGTKLKVDAFSTGRDGGSTRGLCKSAAVKVEIAATVQFEALLQVHQIRLG